MPEKEKSELEIAMTEIISRFDLVTQSSNAVSILTIALGNILVEKNIITNEELDKAVTDYEKKVTEKRKTIEDNQAVDSDKVESGDKPEQDSK